MRNVVLLLPLPRKDRTLRPVPEARRRQVLNRILLALGRWFGSATSLPSWGSWKEAPDAALTLDKGQSVLLVLTTTGKVRRHRAALTKLLKRAGRDLNQEQMAVIAFPVAAGSVVLRCRP